MPRWWNAGRFERECLFEDGGGRPGQWPITPSAVIGLYLTRAVWWEPGTTPAMPVRLEPDPEEQWYQDAILRYLLAAAPGA